MDDVETSLKHLKISSHDPKTPTITTDVATASTITTPPQHFYDDLAHHEKLPKIVVECPAELDMDEDDDGFKTPTSEESKIPVARRCPPPPGPRSSSSKKIRVERVLDLKFDDE
ncbi:hypothetical protein PIB30_040068 [Stylosanthes scabra]|uniref:Uncharacterized protein n=1 Tax=Stylosanthes scabra TaxID=79078 RepID=A0ABU6VDI7_9FABA|nr:hypothetical protein [Stylosanthes scabra]